MRPKGTASLLPKKTPVLIATWTFLGCLGGFLGEGASEWGLGIPTVSGSGSVAITDTKLPIRLGRRRD